MDDEEMLMALLGSDSEVSEHEDDVSMSASSGSSRKRAAPAPSRAVLSVPESPPPPPAKAAKRARTAPPKKTTAQAARAAYLTEQPIITSSSSSSSSRKRRSSSSSSTSSSSSSSSSSATRSASKAGKSAKVEIGMLLQKEREERREKHRSVRAQQVEASGTVRDRRASRLEGTKRVYSVPPPDYRQRKAEQRGLHAELNEERFEELKRDFARQPKQVESVVGMLGQGGSTSSDPNRERHSGIRLKNRTLSQSAFDDRLSAAKFVHVRHLRSTFEQHIRRKAKVEYDWTMIGVLVKASLPKTSARGSKYVIWTLSDFQRETRTVSLFLFSDAYRNLYSKASEGDVFCVANAQLLPPREEALSSEALSVSLSVNNRSQVLLLGAAADFGHCKSVKRNGELCNAPINRSFETYCRYHILSEHKKALAGRQELNTSGTKSTIGRHMLARGNVSRGTFMAPRKRKNKDSKKKGLLGKVRDNSRALAAEISSHRTKGGKMHMLDVAGLSMLRTSVGVDMEGKKKEVPAKAEDRAKLLEQSRLHLRVKMQQEERARQHHLSQLQREPSAKLLNRVFGDLDKRKKKEARQKRKRQRRMEQTALAKLRKSSKRVFVGDEEGASSSDDEPDVAIEFDFSSARPSPGNAGISEEGRRKRLRAKEALVRAGLMQPDGELPAPDPNEFVPHTPLGKRQTALMLSAGAAANASGARRALATASAEKKRKTGKGKKPKSAFERSFGSIDVNSEEGKRLLRRDTDTAAMRQVGEEIRDRQDAYMASLEKKEKYIEQASQVKSLTVKAWLCTTCKSVTEAVRDLCVQAKHARRRIQATKFFFKCQGCGARVTTLNKKHYTGQCRFCNGTIFLRAGVVRELGAAKRDGVRLPRQIHSLRYQS